MELATLELSNQSRWRSWLGSNHTSSPGVWLVFYKGKSAEGSMSYDQALDEALAYGWIDSVIRRIDDIRYARKFTPRRPWSIWSTRNIERVRQLRTAGTMTKWGLDAFKKRTSEISTLEKVNRQRVGVPSDLLEAINSNPKARAAFDRFAPSHKKRYVIWIESAKKPETRERRIIDAVDLISRDVKELLK